MTPAAAKSDTARQRALIARILVCPDCRGDLDDSPACRACGRSFAARADGIVDALPATLDGADRSKEELQASIDAAGPGEHGERVVAYERAFHDEQAAYYDRIFADPLPLGAYYRHMVRHQIYEHVRGAAFVVDLCCGTGKSSLPLVERGIAVVGMDVSREMLRAYRHKAEAGGYRNLLLVHADASSQPLAERSCEAITMIGGLHHIQDRAGSVERCWRALARGGLLVYHEPLQTGQKSRVARAVENLYALTDPARVWRALRRRLGRPPGSRAAAAQNDAPADFTPYERPFRSAGELAALMPKGAETVALRSQGLLSFREFAPYLQRDAARPLASLVVRLDGRLSCSKGADWEGDALFAVFRKSRAG